MDFVRTAGGAGFAGGAVPYRATGKDTLPLAKLQEAHDPVGWVFHEGRHRTACRAFAALEAASHRGVGKRFDLTDKSQVHSVLRKGHFFLFHAGIHLVKIKFEQKNRIFEAMF
jgi:hypothetical protein